jgi:hypothetical protein
MRRELEHVHGTRARWQFSLGCTWAAMLIRARATFGRPAPGAARARGLVLAAIFAALALGVFGLLDYPGLRSGYGAWASAPAFLALLTGYAMIALTLSSRRGAPAQIARRYGLIGGIAVGGAWFVIFSPGPLKSWVILPLAFALLGPASIAALAGRATRDPRTGTEAAVWAGIVGGLTVFIVWVTATYLHNGRPYDAGLLRDFHNSGAPDLATFAVSDDLGSGLVLLLLVPTLALALGSLASRIAVGRPARH